MRKRKDSNQSDIQSLLLTIEQAAQALGVGKDMVYSFIKHDGLPTIDLSRTNSRQKLRISVSALQLWIESRERQQNPSNDLITNGQPDAQKTNPLRRPTEGHAKGQRVSASPAPRRRPSRAS
jgi:excisionase family DNA binding protein